MGIIQKPSLHSYWETNSMMSTPYFGQCMGRDRFHFILRHLRFSDPYSVEKAVKSTRLQNFCWGGIPHLFHICIRSTGLIGWIIAFVQGDTPLQNVYSNQTVTIRNKDFLSMWSSRLYTLCSHVYYGAATDLEVEEPGTDRLSKSELIVVFLLSKVDLLDKGYIINVDNWYNSLRLAEYLLTRDTRIRGTIHMQQPRNSSGIG